MKKPGGKYFEYRSGLGGFVWGGMATKIDPGGSAPDRPRWLENVRIQGGSIISRPDFIGPGAFVPAITHFDPDVADDPLIHPKNRMKLVVKAGVAASSPWQPSWAAEFNSVGGTRLWWGSTPGQVFYPPPAGTGWVEGASGAIFGYLDTDSDPSFNTVGRYDSDDNWPPVIEKFNTEVYVGDFGCLRKVLLVQPPPGKQPIDVLSAPSDVIVLAFPGFRATAMIEFQGKLWLLLTDPSGTVNGEIWSYDGFVANSEYTLAVPGATGGAMAVYKNEIVVTVQGFGSIIRRDSAGTWTTHTTGGFDSSPFLNSMAQYRDKLMIMDGVDKIYSWNGTALALEHTIAPPLNPHSGLVPVPAYAYCCTVLNDVFYYGWTDVNAIIPITASDGELNYTANPALGNSFVVPSDATHPLENFDFTYVFGTFPVAAYNVTREATEDATLQNLMDCINQTHPPTGPENTTGAGAKYYNPYGPHPAFLATLNTGLNKLSLTPNAPGDFANVVLTVTGAYGTTVDPAGGDGPSGQYLILGRHDADNPMVDQWDDMYVRNNHIYRWSRQAINPPNEDGAITAMAQYRGRLWLAVSGIPAGNSFLMTHLIQYAPYDGWVLCEDVNYAGPDDTGYGQPIWGGHGMGSVSDFFFMNTQIYYLRSI